MVKTFASRLLNKNFWIKRWKKITALFAGIFITGLILFLLIGGQQDVGAKEAGSQIVKLVQNIRAHYRNRPDFWGLSTKEVINKKIYPLDMTVHDEILTGYFANPVEIGSDSEGTPVMPTVRNFVVAYKGLSKDQCIGLAANRFEQNFWLGVTGIEIESSKGRQLFEWSSKEFGLPAAKSVLKRFCATKNNTIIFKFE